jgi:hypothetical protein
MNFGCRRKPVRNGPVLDTRSGHQVRRRRGRRSGGARRLLPPLGPPRGRARRPVRTDILACGKRWRFFFSLIRNEKPIGFFFFCCLPKIGCPIEGTTTRTDVECEKPIVLFLREFAVWLKSQRLLHVQGDAGHPVNSVVDSKRINGRNGGPRRRRGTRDPKQAPPPKKGWRFLTWVKSFGRWNIGPWNVGRQNDGRQNVYDVTYLVSSVRHFWSRTGSGLFAVRRSRWTSSWTSVRRPPPCPAPTPTTSHRLHLESEATTRGQRNDYVLAISCLQQFRILRLEIVSLNMKPIFSDVSRASWNVHGWFRHLGSMIWSEFFCYFRQVGVFLKNQCYDPIFAELSFFCFVSKTTIFGEKICVFLRTYVMIIFCII